jgi:hypothetical protein
MKNIGGNLNFEGRAVYLHGVLGLDRRYAILAIHDILPMLRLSLTYLIKCRARVYIGQSASLRTRVKQHWNFRYRRDNPSLHYYAVQNSIYDVFAVLAMLPHSNAPGTSEIPGMDQPDLFLNVLETWCCLLFRCLPHQALAEYLVPESIEGKDFESGALNIANPLDHGGDSAWDCIDLKESRDPLVLAYLRELERKATPDIQYVEVQNPAPGIQTTTLLLVGAAAFAGFVLLRRASGAKWG